MKHLLFNIPKGVNNKKIIRKLFVRIAEDQGVRCHLPSYMTKR